jgi:hypothetical protein
MNLTLCVHVYFVQVQQREPFNINTFKMTKAYDGALDAALLLANITQIQAIKKKEEYDKDDITCLVLLSISIILPPPHNRSCPV